MKKYFLSHPADPTKRMASLTDKFDSSLKNKSIFNPQNPSNHFTEVFKNLILKDIEDLTPIKRVNPEYITEGIKSLKNKKNIIIRPADKGGGVVVMDKSYYHNQLMEFLGDQTTYKRLVSDPTEPYRTQLNSLVEWDYGINALNL